MCKPPSQTKWKQKECWWTHVVTCFFFFFPGILPVNSHKGQLQQVDQSNHTCNSAYDQFQQWTPSFQSEVNIEEKNDNQVENILLFCTEYTEMQDLPAALLRHLPQLLLLIQTCLQISMKWEKVWGWEGKCTWGKRKTHLVLYLRHILRKWESKVHYEAEIKTLILCTSH